MAFEYILLGGFKAGKSVTAEPRSMVKLLVWLDSEAERFRSEMFARVQRQYSGEVRKDGAEIEWLPHITVSSITISSPHTAQYGQPLITFDGVKVFEIQRGGSLDEKLAG